MSSVSVAPHKKMVRRMLVTVSIMLIAGFLGLSVRLGYLQLLDPGNYQEQALSQQMSIKPLPAQRGSIYDRNGKTLAQSATVWQVSVSPKLIENEADRNAIANTLARILELDPIEVYEKVAATDSNYATQTIKKQVEKEQADEIRAFMTENQYSAFIALDEDYKRYYPYEDFAATVLGFTGADHQGLYGLEYYYDEVLSGTSGRTITMSNAKGGDMPFPFETTTDPQDGNSLILTLDERIQSITENHMETALLENKVKNRVCAIVMDVNTGEILAMTTKPEFDPNDPFTVYDEETLLEILQLPTEQQQEATSLALQEQWKNKAVTEMYEPGSVFKIITASSALDAGAVTMDTTFNCDGSTEVEGVDIGCWQSKGHWHQDFTQALMNSCNPAFVDIGTRLGAENFYNYFKAFGFTEKTGIDLPGEAQGEEGVTFHSLGQIGPVELAIDSFGQTFKVTPIQLITAVSAAVNGGNLVTPHVVKNIVDSNGNVVETYDTTAKRQVISEETSQNIALMLEQVVVEGSGKNAYVRGYRIGGKTGTSEKTETRGESGKEAVTISSFLGIAPADDPQVAVLVMLDEPEDNNAYGSTIAAPVVGKIMSDILPLVGVEPKYTAEELADAEVMVPNVMGQNSLDAEAILRNSGLDSYVVGDGGEIVRQIPSYGNMMKSDGTVILYTENADASETEKQSLVPNLIGCTPSEANYLITQAGLNMRVTMGSFEQEGAVVSSQSIADGLMVELGTIIEVQFTSYDYNIY